MCNAPAKNAHYEGEYWQVTVWVLPVSINQLKCFTCANKVQKLKIANPINQQISMYLPLAHIDTIHASGQTRDSTWHNYKGDTTTTLSKQEHYRLKG